MPYDAVNHAVRFYFAAFLNQYWRSNPDPQRDTEPLDLDYLDRLMCGQVYAAAGLAGEGRHRERYPMHVFSTHAVRSKFLIAFGGTNQDCLSRFNELKGQSVFCTQKDRYDLVYAGAPKVHLKKRPGLSEMTNLLPVYYESLKVRNQSVRAVTAARYWVWGWDGILAAFGMLWARDYDYVKKMLRFYISRARPNGKIAHQYGLDMLPTFDEEKLNATDYLMLALIARYFDFVQDEAFFKEVAPYYANAFGSIQTMSDEQTGFIACGGLYPDYPDKAVGRERIAYPCMEQTCLHALCGQAEAFGRKMGNAPLAKSAQALKAKIRANFSRCFYDNDRGYLYESVALNGYRPNPCYPKWNIFGIGLKGGESLFDELQIKRMADFAFKNYFSGDDLRSIPLWDKAKDLAPHGTDKGIFTTLSYPIEDLSLYKLFKCAGHQPGMEKLLSRMERIYSNLKAVPELVPTSQAEFLEDLYSDTRSSWQAFAMGTWHCLVVEGVLGLDAENGAIRKPTFPEDGVEYEGF
ncbi:MAG: hypothetical protein L6437_07495 [Kiritimatiellae bacterium]|nr:hypothetical protein [Kiritimatiellia bacterium]